MSMLLLLVRTGCITLRRLVTVRMPQCYLKTSSQSVMVDPALQLRPLLLPPPKQPLAVL